MSEEDLATLASVSRKCVGRTPTIYLFGSAIEKRARQPDQQIGTKHVQYPVLRTKILLPTTTPYSKYQWVLVRGPVSKRRMC